ncbi:MAG: hypothetical protein HY204_02420 [Nitrospirae bacterium]|nr:hypothetical protein [Nitrospirota bacterium]
MPHPYIPDLYHGRLTRPRGRRLGWLGAFLWVPAAVGLLGCAAGHGTLKTLPGPEPAKLPFSKQSGILSHNESSRIELAGGSGSPVTMVRLLTGKKLRSYQRLDTSTVFFPDTIDKNTARQYTQKMHRWVADRIRKRGYTVGNAETSQAGVSIVYSPFRSLSGRTAFEIIVIVFDRKKGAHILNEAFEKNGLPVVLESAVWISATRLYPKTDLPPWPDPTDRETAELFKSLLDSAFANFVAVAKRG